MKAKQQEVLPQGGISAAVLKWIAIISMFIDHVVGAILWYMDFSAIESLELAYDLSRQIGRLAFPIFAFLMVQGYQHTSNLERYIRNLIIFALISQIPFTLAFYDDPFYTDHFNIFFTLALGIIGLALFEKFEENNQIVFMILAILIPGWLGEEIYVDFSFYGVAFIIGLGILRHSRMAQTAFGVIMGLIQSPAASLAFFPISLYNGERGKQNKWFFYLFYPVHLLLLYFLRKLLL